MNSITWVRDHGIPKFPAGSSEHEHFWREEFDKITNGFWVGPKNAGWFCPGELYLFVNYLKIEASDIDPRKPKILRLPDLRDMDIEFFEAYHQARQQGKGLVCPGPRELGKSYWVTSILYHATHFVKNSQSLISAYEDKDVDKAMAKYKQMVANEPDEFFKHTLSDTGQKVEYGWKERGTNKKYPGSVLWRAVYKQSADAGVGARTYVYVIDEAGRIPNLIEVLGHAKPMWYQGEHQICTPLIFGTGGDMEGGTEDFKKVFANPDLYNMLPFEPVSREFPKPHGMFIPTWKNRYDLREKVPLWKHKNLPEPKSGTSMLHTEILSVVNKDEAIKRVIESREKIKSGGDSRTYFNEIMYYPLKPSEVFLMNKVNIFDAGKIQFQLEELAMQDYKPVRGNLYAKKNVENDEESVVFEPKEDGRFVIYEPPSKIKISRQYVIGNDPVAFDQAITDSLAASFVYKLFTGDPSEKSECPVAMFAERSSTQNEYNEGLILLSRYYNDAQILYENNVGNLVDYCRNRGQLKHLMPQPTYVIKEIVPDSKVNRTYGIHMTKEIKQKLEINVRDYISENYDRILSTELLNQMLEYDNEGNFDLVMAFGISLFAATAVRRREREEAKNEEERRFPVFYPSVLIAGKNGPTRQTNLEGFRR